MPAFEGSLSDADIKTYFASTRDKVYMTGSSQPSVKRRISWLYPDDGCWGRAHEMCRLMINAGAHPRKVWIYGKLHTLTKNNPNCFVNWGWHVAPTLCVRK